jgi:hypothetical protein
MANDGGSGIESNILSVWVMKEYLNRGHIHSMRDCMIVSFGFMLDE